MTDEQAQIDQVVIAAHHDIDAVRAALDAHPEWLGRSAVWNETPIQAAAHMGNRAIADMLIERGARIDQFTAAMLGDEAAVERALAEDPAAVLGTGVHGMPLLHFAIVGGHTALTKRLIALGAPVNAEDGRMSPLHTAVSAGREDLVRLLVAHGAVQTHDRDGKTPLERARISAHPGIVSLLGGGAR